jgi:hypothetical protein
MNASLRPIIHHSSSTDTLPVNNEQNHLHRKKVQIQSCTESFFILITHI